MALAWGCSVRELLSRLSGAELREWELYYELEPWGEWRADRRASILTALFANVHKKKDARPFTEDDFMPKFGADAREADSPETRSKALLDRVVAINKLFGGRDLRGKRGS